MNIVLKQDYENLGKAMEVVTVKDGYARNFLIPYGIAEIATAGNMKAVTEARKMSEKRESRRVGEAREQAAAIEKVPCTIKVKVGEEDKLFGAVTSQEIAEFLKKEGFAVERKQIALDEPIKQLGVYSVNVKLHREVVATLKVWVVKEDA
jgi:large subunit ribosomal protein L9